jgi:hypothetical protein
MNTRYADSKEFASNIAVEWLTFRILEFPVQISEIRASVMQNIFVVAPTRFAKMVGYCLN